MKFIRRPDSRIWWSLIALLFFACAPDLGSGCVCGPSPPGIKVVRDFAQYQIGLSKIIFERQVERQDFKAGSIGPPPGALSMTPNGAHRMVTIRPSRVYRGPHQGVFMVVTGMGMGDWGFDFRVGRSYLIYADPIDNNTLFTSICTGTGPLEESGPALRLLRGEPASPEDTLDIKSYFARMSRR